MYFKSVPIDTVHHLAANLTLSDLIKLSIFYETLMKDTDTYSKTRIINFVNLQRDSYLEPID